MSHVCLEQDWAGLILIQGVGVKESEPGLMRGRPRVTFQGLIAFRWVIVKTKLGNYFRVLYETYAAYDPDCNTIQILWEFSTREKFLALAHEYIHFFIWQLPQSCVTKLDKWHDELSKFAQHIRILSLPTAMKHEAKNRKFAQRLTQSEIDKLLLERRTGK